MDQEWPLWRKEARGVAVLRPASAAHLARQHPDAVVLLTTFSQTLATLLRRKLDRLVGNEPSVANRIRVHAVADIGRQLYAESFGDPAVADEGTLREMLRHASAHSGSHRFSDHFLWTEWSEVVDAWQLQTWESYRDVARKERQVGGSKRKKSARKAAPKKAKKPAKKVAKKGAKKGGGKKGKRK